MNLYVERKVAEKEIKKEDKIVEEEMRDPEEEKSRIKRVWGKLKRKKEE